MTTLNKARMSTLGDKIEAAAEAKLKKVEKKKPVEQPKKTKK